MNLEKIAELSIGLGAAIGVLWIFLQMIREWKKGGGNVENGNSGNKPVSYWQLEFRKAVKEGLEEFDQGRMDRFKQVIRDVVREELGRR